MTRSTGPDDDPHTIARDLAGAVDSLTALWSLAAQGAALRLSPHQLRALRILEAAPGLNLTALARRMDIGPPTASRLCDRLEAAGLLEREAHPHRRREVRLRPSAHGRRVLAEVAELRTRALASAMAAMAPGDRAAMRRGLVAFLLAGEAAPRSAPE